MFDLYEVHVTMHIILCSFMMIYVIDILEKMSQDHIMQSTQLVKKTLLIEDRSLAEAMAVPFAPLHLPGSTFARHVHALK